MQRRSTRLKVIKICINLTAINSLRNRLLENNTQISDQYDDEIDLRELFAVLWAGKTKIIAITAVFAIASVIYALSVPNQYKATALLAPAQQDSGGISGPWVSWVA